MGDRFQGYAGCAVGATKAIMNVYQGTARGRPRLSDVTVGCAASPADQATSFAIMRSTAVGTGAGAFAPVALDPGAHTTWCTVDQGTFSVQPTLTGASYLLYFDLNQRATFRYVCSPGSEFIMPATNNAGLCLNSVAATGTAVHDGSLTWDE